VKIILLDHQNNYLERLSVNATKNFDIPAISLSYIIILMVQNYFQIC